MIVESMSLSKFLSRYVNLKGVNLNKIKHDEVKYLFPFLKRATFEEVGNNKDLLYTGKVILVNDGKKTIPYYVPELTVDENKEYLEVEREVVNTNLVDDKHYDYSELSEYELRQLLRRKFSSSRNQREAKRELESRGINLKRKIKDIN